MIVVGLDLGTQSLKAVVCDASLAVLGSHAIGYPTQRPQADHAEQDPRAWEAALGPAIAGALAAARVSASDVAAIAIAGQLDGCIAVDAGGAPIHPALIWQDRRADATTSIDARALHALTGQVADGSHLAAKARWLRRYKPARFHQPVSYLVERLTGEAVIDPALASTTMLLELATGRWSASLLDAFELRVAELPALRDTCALAGVLTAEGAALTGLPAGTPVAVGTGDDFATPLGAGVVAPGLAICAIGTAEVVGALATAPILDPAVEPMVETHAYPAGGYLVENPGWLSGGAVRWAIALLGLSGEAELDALAAAAPPGAGGVTFIPALAGAMTPVWRPHARATFHGLAAGHERGHLARAVLEGLAFACRDVVDHLGALGLPSAAVLVLGGGSRSAIWTQIRADALQRPHQVAARSDTCAIGAAMIALVAAGAHRDLAATAALVPAPTVVVTPLRDLDDAYRRYQTLVAALAPLAMTPWYGQTPHLDH